MKSFFLSVLCLTLPVLGSSAPQKAERIVSTSLASDEILLQLLPTQEQRKRIQAVSSLADNSTYADLGDAIAGIPHRAEAKLESILALRPDLVIAASFNKPEFISILKTSGRQVHVMEGFRSLNDLQRHIRDLGQLVQEKAKADELIAKLWGTLGKQASRLKDSKKTCKVLIMAPDKSLVGKNTLIHDALQYVGVENLAASVGADGWQRISEEVLARLEPDWLLVPGEEKEKEKIIKILGESPSLRRMKAWKEKRLILMPTNLFSSFSPRIVSAVEMVLSKAGLTNG
ncbi:MAG: ABC transporter substrate-binding protein [Deltaproteobacteria bacterium]|nr:ABC transporter substrate-binding protein [Deltaproteobacteria bacterium]